MKIQNTNDNIINIFFPFRKLYWNKDSGELERGSIMGDEPELVTISDRPASQSTSFKRYRLKDGRIINGIDQNGRVSELLDFEDGIIKGTIWPGPEDTIFFQSKSGTVFDYEYFLVSYNV